MTALLKKFFFSTRLMAILFIVFAIAMAFGTFIESKYSTETARIWIYNARWFEIIMVFFVINFIGNMFRYRLLDWKKWPVLALHLSWILIIIGAFVTRYISFEGVMPIREGNSSSIFYSDNTFLTAYIDGEIDGEPRRKSMEDKLIATPEAQKSSLPWNSDFNGQEFTISYVGFIRGAKEGLIEDINGKEYLKIVEAGDGNRHDHYLESGKLTNIHNVLFALNNKTEGAINIFTTDSTYQIKSPFPGSFLRMADQFSGEVLQDSLQPLQLRSLYSTAGMQFVIPEPIIKGSYGVVALPKDEITDASQDALIVKVTANGETVQKKLLGSKGPSNFSGQFTVGGLDFSLRYGSKEYELPFSVRLNDFIAEKNPGTETNYAAFMSRITLEDKEPYDYDIFMNNVLDHRGYRFFQSSFNPDEKGTILSVSHDFWGTWITYIGYFLLYAGLMGTLFFGRTRVRDLEKALQKLKIKKAALAIAAILSFGCYTHAQDNGHEHEDRATQEQLDSLLKQSTVSKEHAAKFGELVIQDNRGRMKPMNTFSSELLRKLRRKTDYNDLNSDQVFLSMLLDPALWYNLEFMVLDKKEQNDSIRKIVGIPLKKEYVKVVDFFDQKGEYKLLPYLQKAYATNNPNKFEQDFKDADQRLGLVNRALAGEMLKIFPLLNDDNNKWISAAEYNTGNFQVQDSLYRNFIKNGLPFYLISLRNSIQTGNYEEPDKLLDAFRKNQENHGSEVLLSKNKVNAEITYNKLNIFNILYKGYALLGVLMFFVLVFSISFCL